MAKFSRLLFVLSSLLLINSCKKDVGKVILPELPNIVAIDSVSLPFNCEDTSATWKYYDQDPLFIPTIKAGSLGVHRGIYDPNNSDVIYFIQSDSVPNSFRKTHNLYSYNRNTRKKTKLDSDVMYNIDVNKNGWLVYDKMNLNIYKIKTNGDSLTQLTKNGGSQLPSWSQDGNYIFYIDESGQDGAFKIDKFGKRIDTIVGASSIVLQIGNLIYYASNKNGKVVIVEKNQSTLKERVVLSNSNNLGETVRNFQFGADKEILFWESDNGLYKTDLSSLTTVQIINSQRNSQNVLMAYWVSPISGRIICRQMNVIYKNYYYSEINCYLLEYEHDCKCRRRLILPN